METEVSAKNYELAYHFNPDREESEIKNQVNELEDIIAKNGGSVLVSREPKKKHLSYPLKQKHYSYFGVVDFIASPESLEKINSQLKLQGAILRYLMTRKPDSDKTIRALGSERTRPRMKTHDPSLVGRAGEAADKSKADVKPEEMEKEIEEVLEKL